MRRIFGIATVLFLGLAGAGAGAADETKEQAAALKAAAQTPLGEALSTAEFLAEVRRPFQQYAWGRFAGTINWAGPSAKKKLKVRVAVKFEPTAAMSQIVLNETNDYRIRQAYTETGLGKVTLTLPDNEQGVKLSDLGIRTEDLTFAFIYWDFIRELDRESVSHQACRVMDLRHPDTGEFARVWFSVDALFPLQVWWYRPGEGEPWRKLEMKGFKKHEHGLWFVKTLQLRSDDWKTQIRFDDAELFLFDEKMVPPALFRAPGEAAAPAVEPTAPQTPPQPTFEVKPAPAAQELTVPQRTEPDAKPDGK